MAIEARDRLTGDTNPAERHLSLEIRSSLFGFAVFESGTIVDWGIRGFAPSRTGRSVAVKRFVVLVRLYMPSVIIARQTRQARHESSKSSGLVLKAFTKEAERRASAFITLRRSEVREFFSRHGMKNKQARAVFIAEHFSQLRPKVPRTRKKWESERQIFTVFDAVASEMAFVGLSEVAS
jgi:hypothetical protein